MELEVANEAEERPRHLDNNGGGEDNNSDNNDSEKDDCENGDNNDYHPPPSQHISLSASSPPALFICIIAKSELHCSIVSSQLCMSRSLVLSCFSRLIPTCIVRLYYRPIPWKCHVCIGWHWIGIQLSGLCQWPDCTDAHHTLHRRLLPSQFLNILARWGLICQHLTFISNFILCNFAHFISTFTFIISYYAVLHLGVLCK